MFVLVLQPRWLHPPSLVVVSTVAHQRPKFAAVVAVLPIPGDPQQVFSVPVVTISFTHDEFRVEIQSVPWRSLFGSMQNPLRVLEEHVDRLLRAVHPNFNGGNNP